LLPTNFTEWRHERLVGLLAGAMVVNLFS